MNTTTPPVPISKTRDLIWSAWEIGVLAAALVVALFPALNRAPILLLIPLTWLLRRFVLGYFAPRTPVDLSLAGLFLMLLISSAVTPDLEFSLSKLAGLLVGLALVYTTVTLVRAQPARLWAAVLVLLTTGYGVTAIGILGGRWVEKFPLLGALLDRLPQRLVLIPTADSGFSPNQIGGVLLWLTPIALSLTIYLLGPSRPTLARSRRWLLLLLTGGTSVLFTGTLLLTQSRAALLGFVAGAALWLYLVAGRYRRWLVAAGLLAVLALAVVFTQTGARQQLPALLDQVGIGTRKGTDALSTFEGRTDIWERGLYAVQDFPYTGMGMNIFRREVHNLYPLFIRHLESDFAHAHNDWLQVALDLGLPGLVAYLSLWIGLIALLWQTWRHTQDQPAWRALAAGLAAALCAYAVFGLVDTVALGSKPGFVFWLLVGIIICLHQIAGQPAAQPLAE